MYVYVFMYEHIYIHAFMFFVFVFLFVVIKPENSNFASRLGLEVTPLGVYPLGPRSFSCDTCIYMYISILFVLSPHS